MEYVDSRCDIDGGELSRCRRYGPAMLVMLLGLLAAGYLSWLVKSEVDSGAQREFASNCEHIQQRIEARLQAHKQVLLGGAALFDSSDSITREEWRAYAQRVEVDHHFNGIQGLGFSRLIPREQLRSHLADIRGQGFPGYKVHPLGERELYSSIIYLEPFDWRNRRAFGYDMYAEPVRRDAMERARDSNDAALSGRVVLVQETERDVQAGTLMYVPVYRKGMPIATVEQRRAALYGWVYSPFRMADLMQGVLEGWDDPRSQHIHLQVYDGTDIRAGALMYASDPAAERAQPADSANRLSRRLEFNGHVWTLVFDPAAGELSGIDYGKVWIVALGGLAASAMLFLLTLSHLNTRCNANRIARELTADLREASQYARSLIEASLDPMVTISADGKITDANSSTEKITGLTREQLIGTDFSEYFTESEKARAGYRQVFELGHVVDYPLTIRNASGRLIDVLYNASIYRDPQGNVAGVFAVARDITERKRMEEALRRSEESLKRAQAVAQVGSWHLDAHDNHLEWSEETYRMFGVPQQEAVDLMTFVNVTHPDDRKRVLKAWGDALAGAAYDIEHRIIVRGETRWVREVAQIERASDGHLLAAVGTVQDITERKRADEHIHALAFQDMLTGLPNRRLLQDRLRQAMAVSKRNLHHGALMFMDLDNFKPLNDAYGHDIGDLLLVQVAQRLRTCVRASDTVARFGGDEFIVLIGELAVDFDESAAQALAVADKIRLALAEPYRLAIPQHDAAPSEIEHRCTASIGGALFSGREASDDEILRRGDAAMYQAKKAGRNLVQFYVH